MEPKMYAYQCTKCGKLHHPAYFVCRQCGHRQFKEIPLEGEGILVTWTRVYNLPEGYMKPYITFGVVKFPHGLTVAGQLDTDKPVIGMKLNTNVGVVKEGIGIDYYGFIFKEAE